MTPEQLERIKACLENSEYSESTNCIRSKSDQRPFAFITYQIFDPALVGQFITDAINEKLERIGSDYKCRVCNDKKFIITQGIVSTSMTPCACTHPVITKHPPIQLKNLKDPE